jgi:hypothetical protein
MKSSVLTLYHPLMMKKDVLELLESLGGGAFDD